jgi:hypothetical protein
MHLFKRKPLNAMGHNGQVGASRSPILLCCVLASDNAEGARGLVGVSETSTESSLQVTLPQTSMLNINQCFR